MLDSISNNNKNDNSIVQRRRSGSPYVDPNDLFSNLVVKEEIRNMKPALDKLQNSEDNEEVETDQ